LDWPELAAVGLLKKSRFEIAAACFAGLAMTLERIFCHCEEQRDEAIFRFFNRPAVASLAVFSGTPDYGLANFVQKLLTGLFNLLNYRVLVA
jgi:hypothetical protein